MGFFTDIKSYFKDESNGDFDPAGRYLASVVKAVADQDDAFLPALLGINGNKKWVCDSEYRFLDGKRRADLAIYEVGRSEPTYLVEIKVRDNKDNDHTRGQFEDYENWARLDRTPRVFVISPYGLPDTQIQAISKSNHSLKLIDLSNVTFEGGSALAKLFQEYLMEAGYIMKALSESRASAFTHFLIAAFLPNRHGAGGEAKAKAERVAEGPLVFADIVSNFQLLIQTFPSSPRRPTVQYLFFQGLKASRVIRNDDQSTEVVFRVKDSIPEDKHFYPMRDTKVGGTLCIFAYCPLDKSGYLEIGLWIQIDKGSKKNLQKPVTYGLYSEVSRGDETIARVETSIDSGAGFPSLLSSQQEANNRFSKLARALISKLQRKNPELIPNVKRRLPSEWTNSYR